MSKKITLGIILFIILVCGLLNSTLEESMIEGLPDRPRPQLSSIPEIMNSVIAGGGFINQQNGDDLLSNATKALPEYRDIQKFKNTYIITLEIELLNMMTAVVKAERRKEELRIAGSEKIQPHNLHTLAHMTRTAIVEMMLGPEFQKKITLYNGLRAMPNRSRR